MLPHKFYYSEYRQWKQKKLKWCCVIHFTACITTTRFLLCQHKIWIDQLSDNVNWPPYRNWKVTLRALALRSVEGLTLETSAFNFSTGASWPYQLSWSIQIFVFHFPTDTAPQFHEKLTPLSFCVSLSKDSRAVLTHPLNHTGPFSWHGSFKP